MYCVLVSCVSVCFCTLIWLFLSFFFFFKQKTAYEMRISDWSSDVCSSDLAVGGMERGMTGYFPARAGMLAMAATLPLMLAACNQSGRPAVVQVQQIGRASCRERVCQYV